MVYVISCLTGLQALSHNGKNDYKRCLTMVKMITSFVSQWWKWLQALSHNGENTRGQMKEFQLL